jgi:hypothetical protein
LPTSKRDSEENKLVKRLSIEEAYLWAQRLAAREWRLLMPVGFAFMGLPGLILNVPQLQSAWAVLTSAAQTHNPALAEPIMQWLIPLMLVIFLIGTIGGLAVTALALIPGISVREAILLAFRRVPVLVASLVLLLLGEMIVAVLIGIVFGLARLNVMAQQSLLTGVLLGFGLFVAIRLFPLVPMIVQRRIGPISALRESWMLSQGAFWRIFAAAAIYLVGALVVMIALSTGVGAILLLLGKAAGVPELGNVLNIVFGQAVTALAAVGLYLVAASVFLQLDRPNRGM